MGHLENILTDQAAHLAHFTLFSFYLILLSSFEHREQLGDLIVKNGQIVLMKVHQSRQT